MSILENNDLVFDFILLSYDHIIDGYNTMFNEFFKAFEVLCNLFIILLSIVLYTLFNMVTQFFEIIDKSGITVEDMFLYSFLSVCVILSYVLTMEIIYMIGQIKFIQDLREDVIHSKKLIFEEDEDLKNKVKNISRRIIINKYDEEYEYYNKNVEDLNKYTMKKREKSLFETRYPKRIRKIVNYCEL